MNKTLFKEYAELEEMIRAMEEKKTALRLLILAGLKTEGVDRAETEHGNFTVAHKTSWLYSPKVETLTEKLKIAKHKEEEKGIAKAKVSEYLMYKACD